MGKSGELKAQDYRDLAEFRRQIRQFLYFSEGVAKEHAVEPKQHQLLLALKGLPPSVKPTIGELASRLFIQHHSTVELVNRLEKTGLMERVQGKEDRREVWLRLTPAGIRLLRKLTVSHRMELERSGPALAKALQSVIRNSNTR